jgi:succinate dehydrogenase/fumarate reductase iron-sulfur protein
MMQDGDFIVKRHDPTLGECVAHSYSVPLDAGCTVLSALLYIREHIDPTLAFRYGCRCTKCGECAVDVDGRPRLACLTRAKGDMTISPLDNLPLVRDLVVDRSPIDKKLSEHRLYVIPNVERPLASLSVPEEYKNLIGCLECYGCLSSCPDFDWRDEAFGGPYVFVRLAQLHLDPRDNCDRPAQAVSLGVQRCKDCAQCVCVKGIPIRRTAIATLLGEAKT